MTERFVVALNALVSIDEEGGFVLKALFHISVVSLVAAVFLRNLSLIFNSGLFPCELSCAGYFKPFF